MISIALRAAWMLRSRAAGRCRLHPLQYRHLNVFQRWGVVYRELMAERKAGLPRVDAFARTIAPGDTLQYTDQPQTKSAGICCSICVRGAYKNWRGEWQPPLFIDHSLEPMGAPKRTRR